MLTDLALQLAKASKVVNQLSECLANSFSSSMAGVVWLDEDCLELTEF